VTLACMVDWGVYQDSRATDPLAVVRLVWRRTNLSSRFSCVDAIRREDAQTHGLTTTGRLWVAATTRIDGWFETYTSSDGYMQLRTCRFLVVSTADVH
jgi:hypothetical protein